MSSTRDLRQEIWQCIRLWMFDYYFSRSYPYPAAIGYGFTPALFHALSHWRGWMTTKLGPGSRLRAYYESTKRNDVENGGQLITLPIPADGGEKGKIDYILTKQVAAGEETLCTAESEWGPHVTHVLEDFRKLLEISSPLKLMVFSGPKVQFGEKLGAMQSEIANHWRYRSNDGQPREDWLFVGIPYYRQGWPNQQTEAHVRVVALSTPCQLPIQLREPGWDIWGSAKELDHWMRARYSMGSPLVG